MTTQFTSFRLEKILSQLTEEHKSITSETALLRNEFEIGLISTGQAKHRAQALQSQWRSRHHLAAMAVRAANSIDRCSDHEIPESYFKARNAAMMSLSYFPWF